jgi:hypothetical protein
MIPHDFCLFPAQFCYIIKYIWKVKSCVHIADWCAPWKISNGARDIAPERTTLKTPLPTLHPLLCAGRCLTTDAVSLFVSRSLPSNKSICRNIERLPFKKLNAVDGKAIPVTGRGGL